MLKRILKNKIFQNYTFIFIIWSVAMLVCALTKYGGDAFNNFTIFRGVYFHTINELPLYELYPNEYWDKCHYGALFSMLIAPFALLPVLPSLILWLVVSAALLFVSIKSLPLERRNHAIIYWFVINELYTAACMQQFNIMIAAFLVLSFVFVERNRNFWAAFMIVLGTLTKLYGIVGLVFFLFSTDKLKFTLSLMFWGVILYVLPASISSMDFVSNSYLQWYVDLVDKSAANMFAISQNISFLGIVRKISGIATYSDLYIVIPALILFLAPLLRFKQYKYRAFRLMTLASTLIFLIIFNNASESSTYIIALVGVAIWYTTSVSKTKKTNLALLLFTLLLSSFSATDLFPKIIRTEYIYPYSLKALPCFLVWLKIVYEMCCCDFSLGDKIEKDEESVENKIDIILPCHNPHENWSSNVSDDFKTIESNFPQYIFNLIIVNDGSNENFTLEEENIKTLVPNVRIVSYDINQGKGYAVREGIKIAKGRFTIYTDFDFPYSLDSIRKVIEQLENGSDIVIAKRDKSYYKALSLNRMFFTYGSKIFNRILLSIRYTDTQGGLKGMTKKGRDTMLRTRINRFLFDTEFIYLALRDRTINITEIKATLKDNIKLPNMNGKVLYEELINLLKIAFK